MAKRMKLRPPALAIKLEQGLDATQTKLFAHEGVIMDERDLVDYGARHAYLSLAVTLSGAHPGSKVDLTTKGESINAVPPVIAALANLNTAELFALIAAVQKVPDTAEPTIAPAAPPIENLNNREDAAGAPLLEPLKPGVDYPEGDGQ
jgi:hypothetical protein